MAHAPVVVTNASGTSGAVGKLFEDLSFFLVQRVPSRSRFIADIEANGGKVVKSESKADYLIADHLRSDAPGGSYSYTFIEAAIRDGELPDPGEHATGGQPRSAREVGSTSIAPKGTRTPFTPDDDRTLWLWAEQEKAAGGSVKGNAMYRKLEERNPRHTYQAWRDRYLKHLMDRPPVGVQALRSTNAHPSPPPSTSGQKRPSCSESSRRERKRSPKKRQKVSMERQDDDEASQMSFGQDVKRLQEDIELLLGEASDIELIPEDREAAAWEAFAVAYPRRSASDWKEFYLATVQPQFRAQRAVEKSVDVPITSAEDIDSASASEKNHGKKRKRATPSTETNGPACSMARSGPSPEENTPERPKFMPLEVVHPPPDSSGALANGSSAREAIQINSSQERDQHANVHHTGKFEHYTSGIADIGIENAIDRGSQVHQNAAMDPIVTSEANNAAELQLQAESARELHEPNDVDIYHDPLEALERQLQKVSQDAFSPEHNAASEPEIPNNLTSDVDQADEPEPEMLASTKAPIQQASPKRASRDVFGRPRSETPSSSIAAAVEEQNRVEAHSAAIEIAGFALTEENLAAQEEQLRTPRARGADLPEDGELKDQSDFLKYLQQTMGVPVTQPDNYEEEAAIDGEGDDPDDDENDASPVATKLSSRTNARAAGEEDAENFANQDAVLVSSQEEVDDVLDSNLNWPMSPQQRPHETQPDSIGFETQIQSRKRPLPQPATRSPSQSRYLLSQIDGASSPGQEPWYPAHRLSSPFPSGSLLEYVDEGNEHGFLDSTEVAGFHNEEIDLTIAEPEGGFDCSPSPQSDKRHIHHFGLQKSSQHQEADITARVSTPKRTTGDVVNISSTSPVSSPVGSSSHQEHESSVQGRTANRPDHALETQDIFDAETQFPDLQVPGPSVWEDDSEEPESRVPSSDDHAEPPSDAKSRPRRSSLDRDFETELASEGSEEDIDQDLEQMHSSQDDATKLEEWISTMKVRGHQEAAVIEALKCTSMRIDLAHLVLISVKAGQGLPDDVPGLWSETEDNILESGNARGIKRLEAKHGWDECEGRLKYLEEWRMA